MFMIYIIDNIIRILHVIIHIIININMYTMSVIINNNNNNIYIIVNDYYYDYVIMNVISMIILL